MLTNCRVLDLTDDKGFLCGKILGDLGADVIKIEPPGGDPSRNIGSFYHDIPDPEKNLYWFAYNSNKRGITLNLEETDGRDLFKKLVETADIVVESTGFFQDANDAVAHRKGGAKKVIISAPAKNEDVTIVLGVNEDVYDPTTHNVISNASCTTNGIAPPVKVLNDNFGIVKGLMTTIHSYTNDQVVLDTLHKDIRRARASALNMIPTTTGAAKLVGRLVEGMEGKIDGYSLRVPTPTVSIIDFVCDVNKEVDKETVNNAFKEAAEGPLMGIMEYCEEQLVSMDFKGNPHSSIIDAPGTMVIGGNMIKILAWYDNEWGYSCRLGDLAVYMASKGL